MARGEDTANHPGRSGTREAYEAHRTMMNVTGNYTPAKPFVQNDWHNAPRSDVPKPIVKNDWHNQPRSD